MADSESKMEVQEETLKGSNKSVALNGHSTMLENKIDNSMHKSKLENGEVECQSPQVNGDVSDKSALDDCELPKSEKTKSDNLCINNDSSNEPNNSDSIPENGKVEKKDSTDSVVKSKDSDITNSVHKTLNNSENTESVNSTNNDTPNSEDIKSDKKSGNDSDKVKTEKKIEPVVQSVDKTNDISSDNQPSTEEKHESKVTEKEEIKSKEEKSDDKMDVDLKSSEEVKEDINKDKDVTIAEGDEAKISDDSSKTEENKTEASLSKEKKGKEKTPKKKDEQKIEIVKRVTRSSSGITKPVKYLDPDPRDIIDDDDDIRITKEVKKKEDDDDIEMIEESDPLAISDADVKKAKEANKGTHNFQERLKSFKQREISSHKGKDSNVIIIDTNTLLKSGGQSGMSQSSMVAKAMNSVSAQTTTTTNATTSQNANIQTAIQAITGGNPAIQGLQSAYLNAIQQVLVAQGNQASNPHYIATLQQYYNTLGALQDDAYVIEAPSFIVPYVMEGKPIESIKDYQERLKKEIEEEEGKKLKEGKDKESKEKDIADKENKEKNIADKEKEIEKDASKDKEGKEKKDKKTVEDEKMEVDEIKEIKEDDKADKGDKKEEEKKTKDAEEKMEIDEDEKKIEKPDETEAEKEKDKKKIEDKETDKSKTEDKETDKSKAEDKETDKSKAEDKEIEETKVEDKEIDIIHEEKDKDIEITEEKDIKTEDKDKSKIDEKDKDKSKMKEKSEDDNKENKNEKKEGGKEEEVIDLESEGKEDLSHLGRWESYYKSSLGKFFLELGLNHAQEFIQADLLKMQKRRVEKLKTNPTKQDVIAIKTLERQLNVSKAKNAHLFLPMKICRFCSYKTESELVMERHLESPHMVNYTYKCNFCEFETRGPQVILFHTEAEHNVRGRLERAPAFFQCPLCPFEDNNKSKMTRHSFSCSKKYKADKNCDLTDWEPPAKIPKIHRGGRPNFSAFGKTFDGLKMPNILPKNLGGLSLNLQNAISSGLLNSAAMASANSLAGRGRGRPVGSYKNITQTVGNRTGSLMYQNRGSGLLQPMQGVSPQQLSIANQVLQSVTQGGSNRVPRILPASSAGSLLPGLAASSSITIQSVQNKSGNTKSPQQPSISITPLPRGGSQSSGNKTTPTNTSANSSSQRPAFVICEICDGYIKDLEQLRNHMNLIHKVKIHPKMIYNRPPLNCQKCQQRFFTDQGLERHLLGTHGLVTSSMQEAANKGKDAGRCPICGKVFQWKLLNHVSRDHKMTLKPAHLSYKCTVCTATFNMYRLFENHVYSAHSVVNKNKNAEGSSSTASSTPAKKPTPVAAGTDSTPLKINDEITIIPQPATKSPNPKSESKSTVSPKKSDSPSMSKEITITKVGSRSSSRRSGSSSGSGGGGVEVISLDDSPQKRQVEETPSKKRTRDTATSKRARTS